MSALRGRWWLVVWLTLVWAALWGELSVGTVVAGAVVGAALLVAFPELAPGRIGVVRPLPALRFGAYFLYKLFEANAIVAWEVVTPSNASVNEAIVAVPVPGASDAIITLVANTISLTPGTITIEVRREPPTLYVHVLHLRSIEDTRAEVRRLLRLAVDAFGDAETRARVAESERELAQRAGTDTTDPGGASR